MFPDARSSLVLFLSLVGLLLVAATESTASPILFSWTASAGNAGSFVYNNSVSPNPVSEFTWDQAGITHSGPAVQYSVSRDQFGTQIFLTGNQVGQTFFSIQMQHTSTGLPNIPSSFAFNSPGDPGWLGGSFITTNNSFFMINIVDQGTAGAPVNDPRHRGEMKGLEGEIPSPMDVPPGCKFQTRCPHVQEICRNQAPSTEDAGEEHWVACHFWRYI